MYENLFVFIFFQEYNKYIMKKKIIIGGVIIIIVILVLFNIVGNQNKDSADVIMFKNTINISRSYVALRVKTDKILRGAKNYKNYDSWNKDMTELIANWKKLEEKAEKLESVASKYDQEKLTFNFVSVANAYTKEEISNVFDKAPAGKKIRTLAKYLGVDAKRAFKILKNDQEFVKADAWNKAGDTFKKLEASAVVIKDGCKVAGFVGAMAMTGGAAAGATVGSAGVGSALIGGGATLTEGTVMIVTGSDLMLEIGEDSATIGLGDNHKVTKMLSGIRSYTDPAASILSITDIPKNVSKGADLLDKVGVVLTEADQLRSMIQDGKLLGINIKPNSKVEAASIKKSEEKKWIKEHRKDIKTKAKKDTNKDDEEYVSEDLDKWLEEFEDVDDWVGAFDEEVDKYLDEVENDGKIVASKIVHQQGKIVVCNGKPTDPNAVGCGYKRAVGSFDSRVTVPITGIKYTVEFWEPGQSVDDKKFGKAKITVKYITGQAYKQVATGESIGGYPMVEKRDTATPEIDEIEYDVLFSGGPKGVFTYKQDDGSNLLIAKITNGNTVELLSFPSSKRNILVYPQGVKIPLGNNVFKNW